jgi:hypothetical protein
MPYQYEVLNEAGLRQKQLRHILDPGKTEIWYTRVAMGRDLRMGLDFCMEHGCMPDVMALSKTHIMLGRIKSKAKKDIFLALQGENWSPNGEARTLIKAVGLAHTSMSVGDIIVIGVEVWFVDTYGFKEIGRTDGS